MFFRFKVFFLLLFGISSSCNEDDNLIKNKSGAYSCSKKKSHISQKIENTHSDWMPGKNIPRVGNTCYASAALQLHKKWLYEMFKSLDDKEVDISSCSEQIKILREIVYDLYANREIDKDKYKKMIQNLGINPQEYFDNNEFLIRLINDKNLDKILSKNNERIPIELIINNEFKYKCEYTSEVPDKGFVFIGGDYDLNTIVNVQTFIDKYIVDFEAIDEGYCIECKKPEGLDRISSYKLYDNQKYLCLYLLRIQENDNKNFIKIQYGSSVYYYNPFLIENPLADIKMPIKSGGTISLEPIGIVVFNPYVKHYYTYLKCDGNWYKYDDMQNSPCKIEKFDDFKNAISFLYKKKVLKS